MYPTPRLWSALCCQVFELMVRLLTRLALILLALILLNRLTLTLTLLLPQFGLPQPQSAPVNRNAGAKGEFRCQRRSNIGAGWRWRTRADTTDWARRRKLRSGYKPGHRPRSASRLDDDCRGFLRDDLLAIGLQRSCRLGPVGSAWTAARTAASWARKASPSLCVQSSWSLIVFSTLGKGTSDFTLGSQSCVSSALISASPVRSLFPWLWGRAARHHDLQRISRGSQDLGEQIIRGQRDWREDLLEFSLGEGRRGRLRLRRVRLLGERCRWRHRYQR